MFITQQVTLSDSQRALVFKDQQFQKILGTGTYRFWGLNKNISVDKYDVTDRDGIGVDDNLKLLMELYPERFDQHLQSVVTQEGEIALVYQDGMLQSIVPESSHVAFWKALPNLKVEKLDVATQPLLSEQVDNAMRIGSNLADFSAMTMVVTLAADKRALLFRDKQLVQVLGSGHYRFWNQAGRLRTEVIHIDDALYMGTNTQVLQLAAQHEALFADHIMRWETSDNEVGLVYENRVLRDLLPPGKQGVYWQSKGLISVQKLPLNDEVEQDIDKALARQLRLPREPLLQTAVRDFVYNTEIAEKHVGFLLIDGKMQQMLAAGTHAWWMFNRKVVVKQLDMRLQNMEVNGQEILTKDRVSLRLNLSATWQIADAEKVVQELADHQDYLYRELQLALRAVVSTRTLDELLEDKNLLNQDVMDMVAEKALAFGLELKTTGVKDIILPGEMKEILAQVVEAQKVAEANLIRRREETQATRSLHNTAKVMEGNPTLLRLKEMEVLERVVGGVNTLNVYGGLDGVMNDMVKLTDK